MTITVKDDSAFVVNINGNEIRLNRDDAMALYAQLGKALGMSTGQLFRGPVLPSTAPIWTCTTTESGLNPNNISEK